MPWFMATVYDPFMARLEARVLAPWRRELLSGLKGEVLEIGSGTGANLPHLPQAVDRLVMTEPDPHMARRLDGKRQGGRTELHSPVEAESLPFDAGRFDAVVTTLVLCSVRDPGRALGEARRVLKPGGRLVFLEHVVAEDAELARWQARVEPLWSWVAGDCHLTRDSLGSIRAAGFGVEWLQREWVPGAPRLLGPMIRGSARPA